MRLTPPDHYLFFILFSPFFYYIKIYSKYTLLISKYPKYPKIWGFLKSPLVMGIFRFTKFIISYGIFGCLIYFWI